MIGDLGEGIEAVDRREDLAAFLGQERLGGSAMVLLSSITRTFSP